MKYITQKIKIHFLLAITAMMFILSSCNKALEQFPTPVIVAPAGLALGETIATIADDSLYYRFIVKSGLLATINNKSNIFTMYVPNNAAMRQFLVAIGAPPGQPDAVYSGFITAFVPAATAASIVSYNMIPQSITTASIPNTFPNWFYPTHLNPTGAPGAPGYNPLVRLLTFPSTRNGNWINNIPLTAVNTLAANGVIHTAAAMPVPPSKVLAQRIFADADMTYLAAAIQRADSGVAPTTSASLVWVMSNFGPNITVFAPTNLAFQQLLTAQITQALIAQGVPPPNAAIIAAALASTPGVFTNPALANVLTPTVVKGIVVYHLLGSRAFLNNFPTTATSYPTLLNSAVPTHPGVSLMATFTGPFVSAATVKGIANPTASNILVNPTPEPNGTSDQFFVNGIIHKIDQVLRPQ